MGVSLLWVLFFPTIMSVIMGYIALSALYVKMDDKALLPWYNFTLHWSERPAARVADGDRIGLQPNQVIFKSDDELIYKALQNCMFVSRFPDAHPSRHPNHICSLVPIQTRTISTIVQALV